MRKLLHSLLALSILVSNISVYATADTKPEEVPLKTIQERIASAEENGNKYAYLEIAPTGAKPVNMTADINSSYAQTTIDGKACLQRSASNSNSNMFFNINDDYWSVDTPNNVAITVEYYDSEDASVGVIYQPYGWDTMHELEMILTEGTNTWKSKTFYISDFVTTSGTDIRIRAQAYQASTYGQKPIILGSIFVEMGATEHIVDIRAENGYDGMIYDYGKSDTMTLVCTNTKKSPSKTSIHYQIKNNEGSVLAEETCNEISLGAEETLKKEINTYVKDCGTYTITYKASTVFEDGTTEEYEQVRDFSIVRTMEEGDERNDLVAVCAHVERFQYGGKATARMLKRIGISSWRGDGNWNNTEVSQGTYQDNAVIEGVREYMQEDGVSTMLVAGNISNLYNGGRGDRWYVDTEDALRGYGNFVEHLATKEGLKYIEVINEFNHSGINQAKMSIEGYIKYCKAAYEAVQKVNPEIKVIAGGLAGYDTAFIENFMEKGGLAYCDGISYHPYQYGSFNLATFNSQTDRTNQLAVKYSGETKPIYLTEMGWSTANDEKMNHKGSAEEQRRSFVPQMLVSAQYRGGIEKIYYYSALKMGVGPDDREHNFGLINYRDSINGGSATDSFVTMAAACKFFAGATPNRAIEKSGFETVAYEFERPGRKNIAALWTSKANAEITVKLGCASVQLYDMYGTPKEVLVGQDGKYKFNLTDDVIYVEGDFTSFEEAESDSISQDKTKVSAIKNDSFKFSITDSKNRNLKVKLDFDKEVFEADTDYELINGTCNIKVNTKDKTGDYHISVTVYDDNGIHYIARMPIKITSEMLDIKMQTLQPNKNDSLHWVTELTITNISNENQISGKCKIVKPDKFKSRERTFTNLAPGDTITIRLNIPEMLVKRPETITVEVETSNGEVTTISSNLDFTSANFADKKPKIDGVARAGEWNSPLLGEEREEKTYMLLSGAKWGGVSDLSCNMKMLYDEDYLYMMCKVRDNIFCQEEKDGDMWKADSVQIAILEDNTIGIEAQALAFTELAIGKNGKDVTFYRHSSMSGKPSGRLETCEGVVTSVGGFTTYEVKIPWTELLNSDHKAEKGDVYAFSMLVNDSDGNGRRGFICYNDGIGNEKNPSKFGRLQLN